MNFFTRHLRESSENYFEHFLFTFATALWLVGTGLVLLCHAIFPFIFVNYIYSLGSNNIGPEGGRWMGDGLSANSTLTIL